MILRTVHLHGALGRTHGRTFQLAVDTPAEAIRALMCQLDGFREDISAGTWRVVRSHTEKRRGGRALELAATQMRLGQAQHIHIVPAAAGRGGGRGGATVKIILGVALLAAAVFTAGAALAAATAAAPVSLGAALGMSVPAALGLTGATWGSAAMVGLMGIGMILSGVSALISPHARRPQQTALNASYLLNGPVNTSQQGVAMPLIYGRVRCGSILAAGAIRTEEYVATQQANTATESLQDFGTTESTESAPSSSSESNGD